MSIEIRQATDGADIDTLFQLRFQVYVQEEGRFNPSFFPEQRIMDRFDTYGTSANLLAFCRGTPAGFIRITPDGPMGLPVDEHYDLEGARSACGERPVGVSMLGVARAFRHTGVALSLMRAAVEYLRTQGFSDALGVMNTEVEPLMVRFGMHRVGDSFYCSRVGHGVVCMAGKVEGMPLGLQEDPGGYPTRGRILLTENEKLFERGDPGGMAYLLLNGQLELTVDGSSRRPRGLGRVNAGELVGELELFPTQPRTYTATARSFCELLEVPAEELMRQLSQGGGRLQHVLSVVNRRMDDVTQSGVGSAEPLSGLRLFNDYLTCRIIHTLGDLKFFDALGARARFDARALARDMGIPVEHLRALLDYLRSADVVRLQDEHYVFEPDVLDNLVREYGFIEWLLGAYDPVLDGLERLIRGKARYGEDVRRDDSAVARSSATISRIYTDPKMYSMLEMEGVKTIVDIGTGSGVRLIEICTRFPNLEAIGVDISADCCEVARQNVRRAGMQERVHIVQGRAEEWLSQAQAEGFAEIDMVMCFAMFHDLLNHEGLAEKFLRGVVAALKPGAYVMIQDQLHLTGKDDDPQNWVSGFELIHHFMGQRLFTCDRYEQVFAGAGLQLIQRADTPIPGNYIFLLQVPREGEAEVAQS